MKPFNIRIALKPTRTLRHLLTNVKDKDDPKDRQGTVYRIRCNDCNGTYIGETGRTLTTRLGEHQTATDKEDLTNNIAQHHRKTGHDINWDSATCLTHSTDKDQRLTLESCFTQPTQPLQKAASGLRKTFTKRIPPCRRKTPTDFDKYVTAAYYFTRTITVTNLLTPTITNKHSDGFELYVTIDRFYKANATLPTKTPTDFI